MNKPLGFTLPELMVAMLIGSMVIGLAGMTLQFTQRVWLEFDQRAHVQARERLVLDIITRMVAPLPSQPSTQPVIFAVPNAWLSTPSHVAAYMANNLEPHSRTRLCTPKAHPSCQLPNDALALAATPQWGLACGAGSIAAQGWYWLHVKPNTQGVATLYCSYPAASGNWVSTPLVEGVDSLQVQLGLVPPATSVLQWRTPETMHNDASSDDLWRFVRAVRIALIFDGGHNQSLAQSTLNPFGDGQTISLPNDGHWRSGLSHTFALQGVHPL